MNELASRTPNELCELARQGDARAENLLFEKLAERFRLVARRYVDGEAAGDIAQDACAVVLRKYRTESYEKSFEAWCQGVIKMTIRSYIQKRSRQEDREAPMDYEPAGARESYEPGFLDALRDCLRDVASASQVYARVLNLSYQGYKAPEICQRLGITSNNCYVNLHRARDQMTNCLEGKGYLS